MEENQTEKTLKGYKIIIVILAVVLVALAAFYFQQVGAIKSDFNEQRDTLVNRLSDMMTDFNTLQVENDTITEHLTIERQRADSLMDRMQQERSWSYSKIRKYEKELGTMRVIMRGYVRVIDSLNTMNQGLISENVKYRKEASTLRLRAETAEEQAQELNTKVRKGAVILARNISLLALNNSDKEVTRASRAARLRTDFILTANELATPGDRTVYVRITGPDGYLLANSANSVFESEGERLTYSASRTIDYQNRDLNVNIFYSGNNIVKGKYSVQVYMDSQLIGSNEIILK